MPAEKIPKQEPKSIVQAKYDSRGIACSHDSHKTIIHMLQVDSVITYEIGMHTGCSIYFETIFIELFFLSDLFRSHEFHINLFL
jgi:hypothetical protein